MFENVEKIYEEFSWFYDFYIEKKTNLKKNLQTFTKKSEINNKSNSYQFGNNENY